MCFLFCFVFRVLYAPPFSTSPYTYKYKIATRVNFRVCNHGNFTLHKKWSFPLRISSVNVIKSDLVTFTEEILNGKLRFLCSVKVGFSLMLNSRFRGHAIELIYLHCVKSVHIWSFSGSYFPTFGLNTDQKNSEYGHFYAVLYVYLYTYIHIYIYYILTYI